MMKKIVLLYAIISILAVLFFFRNNGYACNFDNPGQLIQLKKTVALITTFYEPKENPDLKPKTNTGAGVFVSSNGHILITNDHIISKDRNYELKKITIQTYEGDIAQAELVWSDKELDLAVIKAPLQNTLRASISPKKPAEGNKIVIIGHPFIRLTWHLSFGEISTPERNVGTRYPLVEVDGHINPGNSGGGAFDPDGKLIGIVKSAISSGQNIIFAQTGIGFFIPIEYFCNAQPSYCLPSQ